jgi:hypothetical protein
MKYVNQAGWDRILRVVLGTVLLVLGFGGMVTGGLGLAFKILGAIALLTGIVGICPAYLLLKFRTNKVK